MNNSVRCLLLLSLALFNALPVLAQATTPKKVALLAGVNVYLKRGFTNLDYAERDATELEKELKKLGFKTVLLTGSGTGSLKATRQNIDEQLLKLLGDTGKQDIVLVALSGHGQQLRVKVPGGGEREDGFYCPYDAEKDNPDSQFSLSYLTDEVLAKKGGRNLVLIDACREEIKDAGRGSKGVQGKVIALPEDTAMLFSCRAGQRSWENDELKHGVFTYCVLEGLRGGAAKGTDITWANLVNHVDEQMASQEMKKYLAKAQEPIPAGGVGRTVLGSVSIPKPNPLSSSTPSSSSATKPSTSPPAIEKVQGTTGFDGKKAGDLWEANGLKMKFRWCPPGQFTMGSPKSEPGRADDEVQVSVTLARGFWLSQFETTQEEWRLVMGTTIQEQKANPNSYGNVTGTGLRHPMYFVNHDEVTEFCVKMTESERRAGRLPVGMVYRLPSEAEWEYACRAGTTTAMTFGNSLSSTQANFAGDFGFKFNSAAKDLDRATTIEVGNLNKPNAWGFHDMHGNVQEWCADWYVKPPSSTSGPASPSRVIRGGDYRAYGLRCRSAARSWNTPDNRSRGIGFRVALGPELK